MCSARVSSYRRIFHEDLGSLHPVVSYDWGGRHRVAARSDCIVDEVEDDEISFRTALSRDYLVRCLKNRGLMARLNNRLVNFIENVRCLEEENEVLEAEIELMRESVQRYCHLSSQQRQDLWELSAVVEKLEREKEETWAEIGALHQELCARKLKHEQLSELRSLVEEETDKLIPEIDLLTGECLGLKKEAEILEDQLDHMQQEHEMQVGELLSPEEEESVVLSLDFTSPDMVPAVLDIQEHYQDLASCLKLSGRVSRAIQGGTEDAEDTKENLKLMITDLEKELAYLIMRNEQLETEIQENEMANEDEIICLEDELAELKQWISTLKSEMAEKVKDYRQLLSAKMALDLEIAAYRSFIEEEDERLYHP
ncbi:low molecular weight neuronal intermediate filament [Latimeria chalumnae]|uniref:low molecular weight neuronal intermediate filament n=1 Tax=Latimeria chalumnae TaxID=7897 RepID=UPI00313E5DB2